MLVNEDSEAVVKVYFVAVAEFAMLLVAEMTALSQLLNNRVQAP